MMTCCARATVVSPGCPRRSAPGPVVEAAVGDEQSALLQARVERPVMRRHPPTLSAGALSRRAQHAWTMLSLQRCGHIVLRQRGGTMSLMPYLASPTCLWQVSPRSTGPSSAASLTGESIVPDGDSPGPGSGKGTPRFLQLTRLVAQETISLAEARRRAVTDGDLLSNMSLKSAVALAWTVSCDLDIEMGYIAASLLCDWVEVRFPDRPDMLYETGRVFLATATQVLMERADAELYRQASPVAEKLVAAARSLSDDTKLGDALIVASRFHLEPYAPDPTLDVRNSNFGWLRSVPRNRHERRAWKVHEEFGNEMPPHGEALDRADRYLGEAAALLNGADRGYVLVHRAFALYSALFFEGSADKDRIRDYCYEAASLMPSHASDALACARLLRLLAIYGALHTSRLACRLPLGHSAPP